MIQYQAGSLATVRNFVFGPFPVGTRCRAVNVCVWNYAKIVAVSDEAAVPVSADTEVAIWPVASRTEFRDATFASAVGRNAITQSPGSHVSASNSNGDFAAVPPNIWTRIPLDWVSGELGSAALLVSFGGGLLDPSIVGGCACSVEVELPRVVNSEQLGRPPAPVAKDEP